MYFKNTGKNPENKSDRVPTINHYEYIYGNFRILNISDFGTFRKVNNSQY